jgi:hypothetical protein
MRLAMVVGSQIMGKGYAEGPAAEEAEAARERGEHLAVDERPPPRRMVWGCTTERPESHVIGEVGEVDPDELFASGRAWGIHVELEIQA